MKTRIITACALLPLLLIIVLFAPKICTAILFGTMASVAAYELIKATGCIDKTLLIGAEITAFIVCIISYFGFNRTAMLLCILLFTILIFATIMIRNMEIPFEKACVSLAGAIVIPYLFSALIRIHTMASGRYYILIPFVIAFLSDTGAYFTGIAIGKHKLAPSISPKKTVEGVFGGIAGAIIDMVLYCIVLQAYFSFKPNYVFALVYGALGSVFAVFGVLCFTVIKRQTGIKDYGNLFPGHGGVLDRFDSMLIVAPLAELLLIFLPLAV